MRRIFRRLLACLPVLLCLAFFSCDGGTRGTGVGGPERMVIGNLRQIGDPITGSSSMPLEGVIVSAEIRLQGAIVDSETTATDLNGDFLIIFSDWGDQILFRFSSSVLDAEALLSNLPLNASQARIAFAASQGSVTIESVEYETTGPSSASSSSQASGSQQSSAASSSSQAGSAPGGQGGSSSSSSSLPGPGANFSSAGQSSSQGTSVAPSATPTAVPTVTVAVPTPTPGQNPLTTPTPTATSPGSNPDRIVICHRSGNSQQTITINVSALSAHLAHGDTIGPCED